MITTLKTNITVEEICDGFVYKTEGKGYLVYQVNQSSQNIKEIITDGKKMLQ